MGEEGKLESRSDGLVELETERKIGGMGRIDDERRIPVIDLESFVDVPSLDEALWKAAVECGFFQLTGHGFSAAELQAAFLASEQFFALPEELKSRYPLIGRSNAGWETMAQVRPSTGLPDTKESYQVTLPRMEGLWPDNEVLPGFRETMESFEAKAWQLAMRVLSSFARRLGFDEEFFHRAHDPSSPEYQSTLRLLHYFPVQSEPDSAEPHWRAGAHTDFDCLTLLFQRDGQSGLQVCPGVDAGEPVWTAVAADSAAITCNIGDMLMRWSDDQLRSTLHRVAGPKPGESVDDRYTIAFFAQANCDQVIQGPLAKYPSLTAREYLQQRIAANFG